MSEDSVDSAQKMIIIGLDNAGKTTILKTLKQELTPKMFANMKPTTGVNIEEFTAVDGTKFMVWDFGGQLSFREEYFRRKDYYFSKISKLIYVIDIQDPDRFDESITYLLNITGVVKLQKPIPNFIIFVHKYDPELLSSEKYENLFNQLTGKIKTIFKPLNIPLKFFKTSVYTIFQKFQIL
ncbi:MAG: GTP-binding protein [Candidatus Helarchaeota archaeon]|nr:GTP-binding protein [Candidatus Helarchaeota archaeon]